MAADENGSDDPVDARGSAGNDDPTDREVVETAAEAAEGVVFANYGQREITDLDVTVTFEEGVLDVDVYLNVSDDADPDPERVVDEAARAARDAVDELFAGG